MDKFRILWRKIGDPNQSYYFPKMALLGFMSGVGFSTFLVKYEIETEERKISFFRATTRLGIKENAAFNDIVSLINRKYKMWSLPIVTL